MAKDFTKEDVIQNKKEAIKALNKLLELYINDPSMKLFEKGTPYFLLDKGLCPINHL